MRIFNSFLLVLGLLCSFLMGQDQSAFERFDNLSYTDATSPRNDSLQRLNLILPNGDTEAPLLIWIGGGAWSYVNRHMEMDLGEQFAKEGFAFASLGHRLSPATWRDSSMSDGIQHPEHVKDIATAVAWLYRHADSIGYSNTDIFIGGFSSGAHLAALVCMDSSYLHAHALSTDIITGLIPISGTYDVSHYRQVFLNGSRPELAALHVEAVFGDNEEAWSQGSPVNFIEQLSMPMLLMTDNNVDQYTRLFEERLSEAGYQDLQVVYAHDLAHGDLWRDISQNEHSIYRAIILAFLVGLQE